MPFDFQPTLRGPILEMRPLRSEDFDALFAVASDPLVWEQHPKKERSEERGFRTFFAESLDSGGALVAIDRNTSRIVGSSRFHGYDSETNAVEIGWSFLARAYWGGKYNGEMKALMLDHAFQFVQTIVFLIHPENVRSCKSVEKIGAVRSGFRSKAGTEMLVYEIRPAGAP